MEKLTGAGIILISTALYACLPVLVKKTNTQLPPFTIMAASMFFLFLFSFLASIFFENSLHLKQSGLRANFSVFILIGLLNFFAYWLFILGFKYFPLWQQQMFGLLTPIISGIAAFFILGETISINLFFGLIIISIGIFVGLR